MPRDGIRARVRIPANSRAVHALGSDVRRTGPSERPTRERPAGRPSPPPRWGVPHHVRAPPPTHSECSARVRGPQVGHSLCRCDGPQTPARAPKDTHHRVRGASACTEVPPRPPRTPAEAPSLRCQGCGHPRASTSLQGRERPSDARTSRRAARERACSSRSVISRSACCFGSFPAAGVGALVRGPHRVDARDGR